jgi:hypothetical protein
MGLHVLEISVLGILFALVGHMDQEIEPRGVRLAAYDRQELLFMEHN